MMDVVVEVVDNKYANETIRCQRASRTERASPIESAVGEEPPVAGRGIFVIGFRRFGFVCRLSLPCSPIGMEGD